MPPSPRIRVPLVDPDLHFRLLLTTHLNSSLRHHLLNTATSAGETLVWSDHIAPDVVLVEPDLPDLPGADLITRLRERYPHTLFIALATSQREERLAESVHAGAVGYLRKSDGRQAIFTAIDDALSGGAPLSRSVARNVLQLLRGSKPPFAPKPE